MPYEQQADTPVSPVETVPPLALSPDDYRQDLASFNLTREQENALLESLWHIMRTLVEIGWGVDTVQYLLPELFETATESVSPTESIEQPERNRHDTDS